MHVYTVDENVNTGTGHDRNGEYNMTAWQWHICTTYSSYHNDDFTPLALAGLLIPIAHV